MKQIKRAARIGHVLIVTSTILATIALVALAAAFPIMYVYFALGFDRGFYWAFATLILGALTFAGWIYLLVSAAVSD